MIKVLLADDNKMSLKYFSELIRWQDYGYELVATAVDGENAWYDFQKYKPQLVIVDIQMPVISGIELAEKIQAVNPDTVIIFLSSYSEFYYARAAVKLRVHDYLLKHETTREVLIGKLEEIREHLKLEKKKKHLLAREEITRLFLQKRESGDEQKESDGYLNERYDCFFLEIEHEFSFLRQRLNRYVDNAITLEKPEAEEESREETQYLRECCKRFENYVALVQTANHEYVLITEPNKNAFDFCCMLQQLLQEETKKYCSVIILQKNRVIQDCASTYQQLHPCLKQIHFYPRATIIESSYLNEESCGTAELQRESEDFRLTNDTRIRMEQSYQKIRSAKDYAGFCQNAGQWIDRLMTLDRRMIHPRTGQIVELFAEDEKLSEYNAESVYRWIGQKVDKADEILRMTDYRKPSAVVQDAVFLISNHYSNYDLNVEWIAEKLGISPSNLNLQFKKETGFTPWKVIVNTRLSKARELLKAGTLTPNQICCMTGYSSQSYFSKVFKKAYGMSPQEYRRKQHEKMDET